MSSITELTQSAARAAVAGQLGHWSEDVLAALRLSQGRTDGHLNELFAEIVGGCAEFLRDPFLYFNGSTSTTVYASGIYEDNVYFSVAANDPTFEVDIYEPEVYVA